MTNQDVLYKKITSTLVELFEIDENSININSNLYEDLDIDSIDAVDLVIELRKMTGKKIQPDDFKSVRTVEDIINAVEQLMDK